MRLPVTTITDPRPQLISNRAPVFSQCEKNREPVRIDLNTAIVSLAHGPNNSRVIFFNFFKKQGKSAERGDRKRKKGKKKGGKKERKDKREKEEKNNKIRKKEKRREEKRKDGKKK